MGNALAKIPLIGSLLAGGARREDALGLPTKSIGRIRIDGFGQSGMETGFNPDTGAWEVRGSTGAVLTVGEDMYAMGVSGSGEAFGKPGAFSFVETKIKGFIGMKGEKGVTPFMAGEFGSERGHKPEH